MNFENVYKNCPVMIEDMTEDNTLVVYLIVRKSLGMSAGKIGGQCGHAVQYLMEKFILLDQYSINSGECWIEYNLFRRIYEWKNSKTHTKIVLEASDKEWDKLKAEYNFIYVVDAGKTEIEAGSETVGILYPMFRNERSNTLKRLQLLR